MGQEIKVLRIDASGFSAEHDTDDYLTMAKFTAGTSLEVTSGIKINSASLIFANDTDTILHGSAGSSIQVQNLVDKSDSETITGEWTFSTTPQMTGNIDSAKDIVNKEYVDGRIWGLDWQDSVLDFISSSPGAGSSVGDRYIIASGASSGIFASYPEYVAEYFTGSWVFTQPNEGFAAWVEDVNEIYVYNASYSAGQWVKIQSNYNHNALGGLQGGNGSDEYYHMTAAEDTWLASALVEVPSAGNLVSDNAAETITGDWSFQSAVLNMNLGNLVLPGASNASPSEGDTYWDPTSDTLYVYDGANYIDINESGEKDAEVLKYDFTAGEALTKGEVVYVSAANTVMKAAAGNLTTGKAIGIARDNIANAAVGEVVRSGPVAGILVGATAGATYWLDTTAGDLTTSPPTGSGNIVIKVGYAINATDFMVEIGEVRRRAA